MADTTLPALLDTGTHAARPAAGDVGTGALYSCTDHGLVYQTDGSSWTTWATLGGDVSSHLSDATDAHDASSVSVLDTAANFTGTDVEAVLAELQDNIDGVSGGSSQPQVYPYPTSLAGDSDHNTATTGWTDVAAFDTKEIVGTTFLHLQTNGASKDHIVRKTLGTTKAAAFDVVLGGIVTDFTQWSATNDTWMSFGGYTGAGSQLFAFHLTSSVVTGIKGVGGIIPGVSSGTLVTATDSGFYSRGQQVTLRVTRDGSNILNFWYGVGPFPSTFHRIRQNSDNLLYAPTQAGTLERIQIQMHSPGGPGAGVQHHIYVDYFEVLA